MYNWIIWLHVASVFAFLMAHGVSMAVSFQIRNGRQVWIWAALAILIILIAAMSVVVRQDYIPLRKALGLRYFEGNRLMPAVAPAPDTEALASACC